MKNILLLGVARSGKSTLAKKIIEKYPDYKVLDLDSILDAFAETFPGVNVGYAYDGVKNNQIAKFIGSLLKWQVKNHGEKYFNYIIDGDSILPEDIENNFDLANTIVLFLGHNKLTPEEIVTNCRKYDNGLSWSSRWDDKKLTEHAKWQINFGTKIEKQCNKYKYRFVDTSFNRNEILEKEFKKIEKELEK